MIQFVKSLPIVKDGTLQVFFNETPAGNEMTTAQVATAKRKGWNVLMRKDYTWVDYPGEAGAIDENILGDINGDGEVDVTDVVELIDMVLSGT